MKKVFILGNPRSGTSLLRLMLNAHPEIVAPPECGFLHWWYKKYYDWIWEDDMEIRLKNFISDLSSSKKIETWKLDYKLLEEYILIHKPNTYAKLSELVYSFYAISYGKMPKVIIDKNNYYINHLNDLKLIWPDALYIQLVRDGRDVACSYIDIKGLPTNSPYKPKLSEKIADIASEWDLNNQRIFNFISNNTGIVIRYEDVVVNTQITLRKLCDFLNIEFNELMLNYFNSEYYDEPSETIDWKKKTLTPPDISSIGRYKMILSNDEIDEFNKIAKNSLLQFQYL